MGVLGKTFRQVIFYHSDGIISNRERGFFTVEFGSECGIFNASV